MWKKDKEEMREWRERLYRRKTRERLCGRQTRERRESGGRDFLEERQFYVSSYTYQPN